LPVATKFVQATNKKIGAYWWNRGSGMFVIESGSEEAHVPITNMSTSTVQEKAEEQAKKLHIVVEVNHHKVSFAHRRVSGLGIKQAAISQGVNIQLDFCLFRVLKNGHQDPVEDSKVVSLRPGLKFSAVTPDHCS